MHRNAQLAMISIGLVLVNVCDLGYSQHRHQDKAYDSYRRQDLLPDAASAEMNLESCQWTS
jgi:hypothetical protein